MLDWRGGRSAKFGVAVVKGCMLDWRGRGKISQADLPNMSSRTFRCGRHRGLFASRKTNKQSTIRVISYKATTLH